MFSQSGYACGFQSLSLGSLPNDGGLESLLIPALQFFSLLCGEGLRVVLVIGVRWTTIFAPTMEKSGWATLGANHEDFCSWIIAFPLGKRIRVTIRQIEQTVKGFVGFDCCDLRSR